MGTEHVRVSLCEDRHSIQAYFDKFLHADVNDPEIRDQVFEYFVDKVYLYDDKLVVSMWFSEDDKQEITWRDWFSLDEYWTDESPFVKGEAVEFDCFPLGSTMEMQRPSVPPAAFFFPKSTWARTLWGRSTKCPTRRESARAVLIALTQGDSFRCCPPAGLRRRPI